MLSGRRLAARDISCGGRPLREMCGQRETMRRPLPSAERSADELSIRLIGTLSLNAVRGEGGQNIGLFVHAILELPNKQGRNALRIDASD
jgi:hypothetical protein